ncbi:MAG: phosphoribosylformylglycinamidine synthase subunit PurS [Candidatus Verstraetearchaeota archaeon]|nr:phosphoribosylformylglycinamidine synthase subunit PurS [Candidatus Verstraetearchaeota archaeon]
MIFTVKAEVSLKRGHFDPEGDVAAKALRDLGFGVASVRVGKTYTIKVEAADASEAEAAAKEMCRRLLSNPTKDDFKVEVLGFEGRSG